MTGPIVVGLDGHEAGGRALERGIAEAKSSGARLVIVVVEEAPFEPGMSPGSSLAPAPEVTPAGDQLGEPSGLRRLADEAVDRARDDGLEAAVGGDVGDPARTIVDAARDHGASSIVLGFHHYNRLQRLLGEDVAAEVKRHADCEVITVR